MVRKKKKEKIEYEKSCEKDGKACKWVVDETKDPDNGKLMTWDMHCSKCHRWRDWKKQCKSTRTENRTRKLLHEAYLEFHHPSVRKFIKWKDKEN